VNDGLLKKAAKLRGVNAMKPGRGGVLIFDLDDPEARTPDIVEELVKAGARVKSVNIIRPTLEDTYLELTKEGSR